MFFRSTLIFWLVLATAAWGQQFDQVIPLPLGFAALDTAVGDLVGDSRADIAVLQNNGVITILENQGLCASPTYHTITVINPAFKLKLADVDADGDLDIIVGHSFQISVLRRQATGFSTQTITMNSSGTIYVKDLDSDGMVDIVRGLRWAPQNGGGAFPASHPLPLSMATLVAAGRGGVGDVTGDGHVDIVLMGPAGSGSGSEARTYINDGMGNFSFAAATPVDPVSGATLFLLDDLNADGIEDFIGVREVLTAPKILALLGSASGTFTSFGDTSYPVFATPEFLAADMDMDGDKDIIWSARGGLSAGTAEPTVSITSAVGAFSNNLAIPTMNEAGSGLSVGDLSGNGMLDLVFIQIDGLSGQPRPFVQVAFNAPQPLVTDSVLSVLSGEGQVASQSSVLQELIVVEIRNCEGQSLAFTPVTCSVTGDSIVPATLMTDAMGQVQIPMTTGFVVGEQTLTVSHDVVEGESVEIDFLVRGLTAFSFGPSGSPSIVVLYEHENLTTPITITADLPLPAPGFIPTLYGPLYSTLASPGPGLNALDGMGLLGPPDPAVVADPTFQRIVPVPFSLSGQTLVFQAIAYDANYPFPERVIFSAPRSLMF